MLSACPLCSVDLLAIMSLSEIKAALAAAAEKRKNEKPVQPLDDDALFERAYVRTKAEREKSDKNKLEAPAIPPLHVGLPPCSDAPRTKLREEARAEFLQRRSRALLDNEELKQVKKIVRFRLLCQPNTL